MHAGQNPASLTLGNTHTIVTAYSLHPSTLQPAPPFPLCTQLMPRPLHHAPLAPGRSGRPHDSAPHIRQPLDSVPSCTPHQVLVDTYMTTSQLPSGPGDKAEESLAAETTENSRNASPVSGNDNATNASSGIYNAPNASPAIYINR